MQVADQFVADVGIYYAETTNKHEPRSCSLQ